MASFMEIKSVRPKLRQSQKAEKISFSSYTLQRYKKRYKHAFTFLSGL